MAEAEVQLLQDRIDDLESELIELQQTKKNRQANNNSSMFTWVTAVPIMLLVTILLGLNVNVSNGNKEISYSSAGLLE